MFASIIIITDQGGKTTENSDSNGSNGSDQTEAPPMGSSFESDIVPMGPRTPTFRVTNRFNRWMRTMADFFQQGNWFNGGPENLMEYIGRYLARLFDIMMNRENGGNAGNGNVPPNAISTSELFGGLIDGLQQAQQIPATMPQTNDKRTNLNPNQVTLADLIRLMQQRQQINVPN
ncbi:hypothetical protein BLOT_010088 [Blomia tropicalis]|nr:hypothetical protein BLOT_010088 [Blomia tropicalis]